jgi:hypothetical protein
MKSSATELCTDPGRAARIHEYAAAHSTALPQHIVDYHALASVARSDSVMLTSVFQSQFHVLLARSVGAKKGELGITFKLAYNERTLLNSQWVA